MWHNGFGHGYVAGPGNWMGWDGGTWSWLMGFHGLLWILIVVFVVYALVRLIRNDRRDPARDAALAALGQAYADGRLDRDEFLRRKEDLG